MADPSGAVAAAGDSWTRRVLRTQTRTHCEALRAAGRRRDRVRARVSAMPPSTTPKSAIHTLAPAVARLGPRTSNLRCASRARADDGAHTSQDDGDSPPETANPRFPTPPSAESSEHPRNSNPSARLPVRSAWRLSGSVDGPPELWTPLAGLPIAGGCSDLRPCVVAVPAIPRRAAGGLRPWPANTSAWRSSSSPMATRPRYGPRSESNPTDGGAAVAHPCRSRWGRVGSNHRPKDYESPALTAELRPPDDAQAPSR